VASVVNEADETNVSSVANVHNRTQRKIVKRENLKP